MKKKLKLSFTDKGHLSFLIWHSSQENATNTMVHMPNLSLMPTSQAVGQVLTCATTQI